MRQKLKLFRKLVPEEKYAFLAELTDPEERKAMKELMEVEGEDVRLLAKLDGAIDQVK